MADAKTVSGEFTGAFATRSDGLEIYIFAIIGAGIGTAISFARFLPA